MHGLYALVVHRLILKCIASSGVYSYSLLLLQVAVEQGKVGKEKAIADEEEKKVAKINNEVTKKKDDCERDLAKAEPALKVFKLI